MIKSFKSKAAEDIFNGVESKAARKQVRQEVWKAARRKMDQLNSVKHFSEMKHPPNNNLHPLNADWWAVYVSDKYRLVFRWQDGNAHEVDIIDYH